MHFIPCHVLMDIVAAHTRPVISHNSKKTAQKQARSPKRLLVHGCHRLSNHPCLLRRHSHLPRPRNSLHSITTVLIPPMRRSTSRKNIQPLARSTRRCAVVDRVIHDAQHIVRGVLVGHTMIKSPPDGRGERSSILTTRVLDYTMRDLRKCCGGKRAHATGWQDWWVGARDVVQRLIRGGAALVRERLEIGMAAPLHVRGGEVVNAVLLVAGGANLLAHGLGALGEGVLIVRVACDQLRFGDLGEVPAVSWR